MDEMDELLHTWNLGNLCAVFREQEINVDALEALTDADVMELIPKVGPRALFRKRLAEWLQKQVNKRDGAMQVEKNISTESLKCSSIKVMNSTEGNKNHMLPIRVMNNDGEISQEVWIEHLNQDNVIKKIQKNALEAINFTDESLNVSTPKILANPKVKLEAEIRSPLSGRPIRKNRIQDYNILLNGDYTPKGVNIKNERRTYLNKIKEEEKKIIKKKPREAESAKNDKSIRKVIQDISKIESQRCLNVEEILLSTEEGRAILENYEETPDIDKRTRLYIADLIVSEIFAKNLIMDRSKFQEIASQIISIFPNEDIRTWFVQHLGNTRNSGGSLYYRYYTVYRKMRKSGFYDHYVNGVNKHFVEDSCSTGDNTFSINVDEINDDTEDKSAFRRAIPRYERLRRSCDFERTDINKLIESSYEGRGIAEFYKKNKTFDSQTRNRLCKLVVMEAIHKNIKMQPRDFYDISCQIVELFPNEEYESYFLPRGRKPPKGCLYHKYLYSLRRLRKLGVLKKDRF